MTIFQGDLARRIAALEDAGAVTPALASWSIPAIHAQKSADTLDIVGGTLSAGSISDIDEVDATYAVVDEDNGGAEAFDIRLGFNSITDEIGSIGVDGRYQGSAAHDVFIYLRDWTTQVTGFTTGDAKTATGASTDTNIVVTGGGLTAQDHVGAALVVNGEYRRVIANTTTAFTVAALTSAPSDTDSFVLEGEQTRMTAAAEDFDSNTVDEHFDFPVPGDRTRFVHTTLTCLEVQIEHQAAATASHKFYLDHIEIQPVTIDLPVANTPYTITDYTAGELVNWTDDNANGTMTAGANAGGLYRCSLHMSPGSDVAMQLHGHMFINDVEVHNVGFLRDTSADYVYGSMVGIDHIRIAPGDEVKVKIVSSAAGILVGDHGGLVMEKVGN